MIDGEPSSIGGDICDILDLRNTDNVFGRLTEAMKGIQIVPTLGEIQSIQELESSVKRKCKAPTLGITPSIQRLEDLEKGVYDVYALGGDQSMTIVSESHGRYDVNKKPIEESESTRQTQRRIRYANVHDQ